MDSASDLTAVLAGAASSGEVGFRSARVTAWNAETGENTVILGGTEIHDRPILIATEKLAVAVGDVVGVLTIKGQMFILGRLLNDEGKIVVRSATGQVQFRIGRTAQGGGELVTYHPNGVPHTFLGQLFNQDTSEVVGQGFVVQQDDGGDVLGVFPLTPGGRQLVRIRDGLGGLAFTSRSAGGWSLFGADGSTLIAGPDLTHQNLLGRPYMDVPMYPFTTIVAGAAVSVGVNGATAGTFQDFWHGRLYVTHPYVHVQALVACSAAGVTGEVRVFIDDVNVTGNIVFSNTVADYIDFGPLELPPSALANPYGYVRIRINGRRQGDAGLVTISPYGATKRGTP